MEIKVCVNKMTSLSFEETAAYVTVRGDRNVCEKVVELVINEFGKDKVS